MISNETGTYIGIVIGIVGIIISLWPVLNKKTKFFDYAFGEYDANNTAIYAKRTGILWKINWGVSIFVMIILYCMAFKILPFMLLSIDTVYVFIAGYTIQTVSIIIKDLFHNKYAYKTNTLKIFQMRFDSIESLNLSIITEVGMLLIVVLISFIFHMLKVDVGLIIVLAISSLFSCYYRMCEESCDLLHLHKVRNLTLVTKDGTTFDNLKTYSDLGNSVRIQDSKFLVRYISKDAINWIIKDLDEKSLISIIREKCKGNDKQENTTFKDSSHDGQLHNTESK